tara:strand:+ start:844 stop:1758 length:915 start_codon:yes stop_codon:yes gene_type:complete
MADDIEIEDVEDALKRAEELASLTGRTRKDVVADLLDDGKLNNSAGEDVMPKKDFLDVAQEKAEKFKKLLTTLVPILLLMGSIGAEGMGLVDVTGWGEDSVWGDDDEYWPSIIWGCTDEDANNYDGEADEDDDTCQFDPDSCEDEDSDGVCDEDEVDGCQDGNATNYDSSATEDDDSCIYPEPPCEINLYEIDVTYNRTAIAATYDLDCGTDSNEQDGYNVSVQFLVYLSNSTMEDEPINYTTDLHYIQGYVGDSRTLVLDNLTTNQTIYIDAYWYAIWEDHEGESQMIERKWEDIELIGESDE